MSTFTLPPPPQDLQPHLDDLHQFLRTDADGVGLSRLDAYFATCEMRAREMQTRSGDFEDKSFALLLADACAASRRVLQQAWQQARPVSST